MDRGRRAEPYSNATIWTREIARNLAGHLSRVSKAHSCVDTKSPKSTRLPQFHQKRCPTSPLKTRQPFVGIPNLNPDQNAHSVGGNSGREESDASSPSQASEVEICSGEPTNNGNPAFRAGPNNDVNHDFSDKQGRIPAVKPPARQHVLRTISDTATYDSPPALLHQRHRQAHDYNKIQEQRKIWQENQALNKRLQTAKATLNFKEWEKDDKWSQEFLRHQEKRRYALQQELRRAQISPQAVLRSKPLKSLHRHARSAALETHVDGHLALDRTKADVGRAVSSRDLLRRSSKEQAVLGGRVGFDTTMRASAANHRRIVELRKKKPSSSSLVKSVAPSAAGLDPPVEQAAFIPDNEIVTVRFTFSRGRSRGTDNNTEQTDPSPLKLDGSDRDMMSLSGAFSPGVELESALNDVAVEDTDRSQSLLLSGAEIPGDKSESNQSEPNTQVQTTRTGDSHDNQKIVQNMPEVAAESDVESAVKVGVNGSEVTTILTQSDEGDESYGDNFDIEALPSAQAENQHDRLETSGYASEFEDGNTYDVTPNVNPIIGDDDPEDEEEYSHDDFE